MNAPFQPGDPVVSYDTGKYHRVKKCIRDDRGAWGVLFHGVHCRSPYGFDPKNYGLVHGRWGHFDFRTMMGAKA